MKVSLSLVSAMLKVEAALARAEADLGLIPKDAAEVISEAANRLIKQLESEDTARDTADSKSISIDLLALKEDSVAAGNIAIPFVKQFTQAVHQLSPKAAGFVHWGATSQDILDTAAVLGWQTALDRLDQNLSDLVREAHRLSLAHQQTVMMGRTWLQHALPITFGLKAAGWADLLMRHRQRIKELRPRCLALQFGGASGTLASLGGQGVAVAARLAQELKLTEPAMPWHGHRDRVVELGSLMALAAGGFAKIAKDIALMNQTEVAEVSEGSADGKKKGGSSTMPHKRNPVGAAAVLGAAASTPGLLANLYAAMAQEHERALGGWQMEWQVMPELIEATLTSGAALLDLLKHLEVHADRMLENIGMTKGLVMAESVTFLLAQKIGKAAAHEWIESACHQAISLRQSLESVLLLDQKLLGILSAAEIRSALDPAQYLGAAHEFTMRVHTHVKDH